MFRVHLLRTAKKKLVIGQPRHLDSCRPTTVNMHLLCQNKAHGPEILIEKSIPVSFTIHHIEQLETFVWRVSAGHG